MAKTKAEEIAKGSTLLATIRNEFPERCVGDLEQDLYRMINEGLNTNVSKHPSGKHETKALHIADVICWAV